MRWRAVLARIGLVGFGLVLTVVVLELALQIGSLFVAGRGGPQARSWATGDRRILCLGDSNTYGVWLRDRERDAYPSQLERLWNEGQRDRVEVLNLGYPGTNSSRLLGLYPEFLETLAPHVVIVMVGVNDFWTEAVPLGESVEEGGLWSFVKRHSRLYRGYYMLRRRSGADGLEVEVTHTSSQGMEAGEGVIRAGEHSFELGWKAGSIPRPGEESEADLRRDLRALTQLSESSSTQLVLMTYPGRWGFYSAANRAIRAVAGERGVPLIDLEQVFRSLCPSKSCKEYLYKDQHPNAAGYQRVAEAITRKLGELPR